MGNLVVYYSLTGNTEVIAEEIHQLVGGDIKKIEEVKQHTKKNMGSLAFSALLGLKSRLKPMNFSLDGYENIYLGAQVWAAHSAPAINTFLSKAYFSNKKVYLFITKADEKVPQKVIDSITKKVEKRGGKVIDSLSVTTKMKSILKPEDIKEAASVWVKKQQL